MLTYLLISRITGFALSRCFARSVRLAVSIGFRFLVGTPLVTVSPAPACQPGSLVSFGQPESTGGLAWLNAQLVSFLDTLPGAPSFLVGLGGLVDGSQPGMLCPACEVFPPVLPANGEDPTPAQPGSHAPASQPLATPLKLFSLLLLGLYASLICHTQSADPLRGGMHWSMPYKAVSFLLLAELAISLLPDPVFLVAMKCSGSQHEMLCRVVSEGIECLSTTLSILKRRKINLRAGELPSRVPHRKKPVPLLAWQLFARAGT